jgi:16S rRNA (uracil1498-N3)-methyltransferase
MNLFYQPLLPSGAFHLDPEESKHCVRVLRKGNGDEIQLTDGKGFFYDAVITKADAQHCAFEVVRKTPDEPRRHPIHIAISPTKNTERIEWFVEKAVEIGIDKITFIECKNTERPYLKLERMEKVAISAMKQSFKARIPDLQPLTKLFDVITTAAETQKFIAYVDHANPDNLKDMVIKNTSYLTLIGPEGDFSKEELATAMANGFQKVSLGNSRLRTETAGVVACHIFNVFNS